MFELVGWVVIRFMKIRAVVLSCEVDWWGYYISLFRSLDHFAFCGSLSGPESASQAYNLGLCSQGTVSPLSKSVHDARSVAFYLVDYHASVQHRLFSSDVEPRNRKNRIQSTIPGCPTRKHSNFELSITTTALAPLTCLWPTEDTRMVFLRLWGPWSNTYGAYPCFQN